MRLLSIRERAATVASRKLRRPPALESFASRAGRGRLRLGVAWTGETPRLRAGRPYVLTSQSTAAALSASVGPLRIVRAASRERDRAGTRPGIDPFAGMATGIGSADMAAVTTGLRRMSARGLTGATPTSSMRQGLPGEHALAEGGPGDGDRLDAAVTGQRTSDRHDEQRAHTLVVSAAA